mgnify:CR=1 FL=1
MSNQEGTKEEDDEENDIDSDGDDIVKMEKKEVITDKINSSYYSKQALKRLNIAKKFIYIVVLMLTLMYLTMISIRVQESKLTWLMNTFMVVLSVTN